MGERLLGTMILQTFLVPNAHDKITEYLMVVQFCVS